MQRIRRKISSVCMYNCCPHTVKCQLWSSTLALILKLQRCIYTWSYLFTRAIFAPQGGSATQFLPIFLFISMLTRDSTSKSLRKATWWKYWRKYWWKYVLKIFSWKYNILSRVKTLLLLCKKDWNDQESKPIVFCIFFNWVWRFMCNSWKQMKSRNARFLANQLLEF